MPRGGPVPRGGRRQAVPLSIEYTAESFALVQDFSGIHRHARDQWLRASQSIQLNIAEGNGKRSVKDRARYFEITRGWSFECVAIQDVLTASDGLNADSSREMKIRRKRIVSMLTRMVMKVDAVSGSRAWYDADVEHEHRCAEHEHDWRAEPEPTEDRWSGFTNRSSSPGPRWSGTFSGVHRASSTSLPCSTTPAET